MPGILSQECVPGRVGRGVGHANETATDPGVPSLAAEPAYIKQALDTGAGGRQPTRIGCDLYRFAILVQLELAKPRDLAAERKPWQDLTDQILPPFAVDATTDACAFCRDDP